MTPIQLEQVKSAAERKMKGPIGLEEQNTLAYFALAALPVIEAAERANTNYERLDKAGELALAAMSEVLPDGHGTLETEPLIYQCNGLLDEFSSMKTMEAYRMTDSAKWLIMRALRHLIKAAEVPAVPDLLRKGN
jgi:hypothetical protein